MSLLATLYFLPKSNAFPLVARNNNTAADADPSWVSSPSGRGTYDLILGCLTTLSLCAWTAYHPNIHPNTGPIQHTLRRVKWMLTVIFIPEVVLYCAWEQHWIATKLMKEINTLGTKAFDGRKKSGWQELPRPSFRTNYDSAVDLRLLDTRSTQNLPGQSDEPTTNSPSIYSRHDSIPVVGDDDAISTVSISPVSTAREDGNTDSSVPSRPQTAQKIDSSQSLQQWTIEQAFFAVSGGFAVDSSSWWPQPQLTFTPDGILELAKAGLLPYVSQETVLDKSKADVFAKILVCVQAGWFFVQSMARLAQKEPLTLLEIHVLAHVVCAFFMYFLWMKKPYDAQCPVICSDHETASLAALFAVDAHAERRHSVDYEDEKEYDRLVRPVDIKEIRSAHAYSHFHSPLRKRVMRVLDYLGLLPVPEGYYWQRVNINGFSDPSFNSENTPETNGKIGLHQSLANHGLRYLLSRTTAEHPTAGQEQTSQSPATSDQALKFDKPHVVSARSNLRINGRSYFDDGSALGKWQIRQMFVFSLISTLYGGAHLSAWTTHFPTIVEMWLWRAAGISMAAFSFSTFLFLSIQFCQDKLHDIRLRAQNRELTVAQKFLSGLLSLGLYIFLLAVGLLLMLYPVARLYVLGEAFASMRSPPKGTYEEVDWTGFIPHVG